MRRSGRRGAAVIDPSLEEPAYVRQESSLLEAFSGMPQVEAPPAELMENDARIYELRIYESHSLVAGKKKVEMFNEGGRDRDLQAHRPYPRLFRARPSSARSCRI